MSDHMKALDAALTPGRLAVNDLYATIQGEGTLTGVPMVLLRLHGCEVGCPWCDTKETWAMDPDHRVADEAGGAETIEALRGTSKWWGAVEVDALAGYIARQWPALKWVLLTGGEPADQPIGPLVRTLHRRGWRVAMETSGTAGRWISEVEGEFEGEHSPFPDWITVSPKVDMPGGRDVLLNVLAVAHEVKHVVGKPADVEVLLDLLGRVKPRYRGTVCLQPVSQSEKATRLCMEECLRNGWRLSLQVHKYVGVR